MISQEEQNHCIYKIFVPKRELQSKSSMLSYYSEQYILTVKRYMGGLKLLNSHCTILS